MAEFDPRRVRRALVTKLRHHGDVLLASPVFTALRRAAPEAEIDALVYADTAPMLAGHPAVARLHTVDRQWKRQGPAAQAAAEWALLSALRERRFDLVVHLTEHPRGAWLARLTGAAHAVAIGREGRFWQGSFSHLYRLVPRRHTVERNLDALRRLGIPVHEEDKPLVLVAGTQAEETVDTLLAARNLARRPFVHLHPASRWLFKCWPAEKVGALVERFAEHGLPVVLTAAPDDKERALVDAVAAATRSPVVNLAGQLSLKELAALAARARLFVGVDSAPMHIAAAVGTPVVALFGPSGETEWGPWRVPSRVIVSAEHPCRPCGQDGCAGSKVSDCLTTLSVDRVFAACAELLG
ncbi:MAG: putative lipopolysaccharide heptosyltransferase III [Rhodocyclaceae bacterium]|nr:putative lipopolysaccharide heptosyltransferase III [Rhodocyclaceae bacterium]